MSTAGELKLFSEPYQPSGSIDARAAKRAMGKPSLDQWTVFLRETLQNSWDARIHEKGVSFSVDGWFATRSQLRVLRGKVFAERPSPDEEPDLLGLEEILESDEIGILRITDSGTRGLGGTTRGDIESANPPHDFQEFVRNIGRDEAKGIGGGTYGFGKAVLYEASACSAIVFFTRSHDGEEPVSRLMAAALGSAFSSSKKKFTGRHWWGRLDPTTGVEPLTGVEAERLAKEIGLDNIPPGETGTSIMVLAPVAYEDETLNEVVCRIAEAAEWFAWPHMITTGGPSIRFSFSYQGEEIRRQPPSRHPVLKHFVAGYKRVAVLAEGAQGDSDGSMWKHQVVWGERPVQRLGVLAYREYLAPESASIPTQVGDVTSSVALMRSPRFVVKYLHVPRSAGGLATAGVFVADPKLDEDFAASEPVAHDDWVPRNLQLQRHARNPVRQALNRIQSIFRAAAEPPPMLADVGEPVGLAALATSLGGLLVGISGPSPKTPAQGPRTSPSGPGGRPSLRGERGLSIDMVDDPVFVLDGDEPIVEFPFAVLNGGPWPVRIHAEPLVILEGNRIEDQRDAPRGGQRPSVRGWRDRMLGTVESSEVLTLEDSSSKEWAVRITQPPDLVVSVRLHEPE